MYRTKNTGRTTFWILLALTALVWVLRGIGLLTAIKGGLIWFLIIATIGTGTFSVIQQTKRW